MPSACRGRSSSTTLRNRPSVSKARAERTPLWPFASTTNGKSDQGGCCSRWLASTFKSVPLSASSATSAALAPRSIARESAVRCSQLTAGIPWRWRRSVATTASRPRGVRTRTVSSIADAVAAFAECVGCRLGRPYAHERGCVPAVRRHSRQNPPEVAQGSADAHPASVDAELADRPLVIRGPRLHDRNRLPDFAVGLEEPQQEDGVGEITEIDVRADVSHKLVLTEDHQGHDALPAQIGKELVHLKRQMPVFGHGLQVGVQT